MSQELKVKLHGLFTFPSELSEVPDGALNLAQNINVDQESVASPRRGMERFTSYAFGTSGQRANQIFEYEDAILTHYDANKLARDTGAAWSDYSGTYSPPDSSTKVRSAQSNQNFYFTTSTGIKKLDAVAGTPADAGSPKGLTLEGAVTGASGFLANNKDVAYRLVWGITDAKKNSIVGAPSQRMILQNTSGGTRDGSITATIPAGITTTHFYQLYRSEQVTTGLEPSDELFLVYENNPTSAQITAGTLTFTDSTPDELTGAALYTNPSQETISQANEIPPFAKDLTVFKGHMFYSNIKSRHRLNLTLLAADGTSVGPSEALKYDDVITINGVAYTGKATTSVGSNEFKVFSGGTPSTRIRDTAIELCKVINQSASNTGANAIYAYYVSSVNETPGKILLESRNAGGAQFFVTFTPVVANANPWNPRLPTSGTSVGSDNDTFLNGLMFAKPDQPESVPLVNIFKVGQADQPIRRIFALRDSLFILKDDGIYRLTGSDSSSFAVDLFDNTAKIIGENSATLLNNALYFLSDQGVASATETGISVISRPIEDQFLTIFRESMDQVETYSFAVGYESERKYILGTVTTNTDTSITQYFVYNTFTKAWTRWTGLDSFCAFVHPVTDKLMLGDAGSNYLLSERKTGDPSDYADFFQAITITAVSSSGLVLTVSDVGEMTKGDVIYQSDTAFSVIASVDTTASTVTMEFGGSLVAGAATLFGAIESVVEWTVIHAGNAGIAKHFREVAFLFKQNVSLDITAGFSSEVSGDVEEFQILAEAVGNWGYFGWGEVQWGGEFAKSPIRTYVPLEKSRCNQLSVRFTHRIGFSSFLLNGLSVIYENMSERFGHGGIMDNG